MHSTVTDCIDNSFGNVLVLGLAVTLAVGVCVPALAQMNTQNTSKDAAATTRNSSVPTAKLASRTTLASTPSAGESSASESSVGEAVMADPWIQQAELPSPALEFGATVALSGSTAVVGAKGAAFVFGENGGTWNQQAELTASGGEAGDEFGGSVAVSGSTVVVGGSNDYLGTVSVFVESGGTWTQKALLTASDGVAYDGFGSSVAIHGSTIVVGAPDHKVGSNFWQGAAYVFVESGGTWTQQAELTASDGEAYDNFGSSVALTASRVVVGAPNSTSLDGSNPIPGAVYVFSESGGTWTQQAELTESGSVQDGRFGSSVAVQGTTILVGAPLFNIGSNEDGGAAFVFAESGGTWSEQQVMTAPDGVAFGFFGSVALSGNIAMVGADGESVGPNPFQGSVYVYGSSGPLYTLSPAPSSLSVAEGGEGSSTITITPGNGFSGSVSLSALGLPNGVTAAFNPNTATSSSTLTLTASPTATAGTTTPFLVGTSGSLAQTVPLTLAVPITPSPPALNFGNVAINSTSPAKTVTFTNRGTTKIGFIIINVTPSTNFTVSLITGYDCTNGHLAPGQSCVVKVQFEPTALGPVTGTLSFTDDGSGSPQTTALSGTGIAEASLIPASVEFSKQTVGTTSAAKSFALTNNQTVALTNIAISTTGDFAESATTCETSLAAKTKCTISVTFAPTATGTRTGQLSVSDGASNSPQTAALTGTGEQDQSRNK